MKKNKITNASTSHKLNRNLREEFEEYTLRENSQNQDLNDSRKLQKSASNNKTYSNSKIQLQQVPKSYLLGMESLQEAVNQKNQEIQNLRSQLMEKETQLLQSETRINDTLKKCKILTEICQQKDIENNLLRSEIKQLHKDKEMALRQASKFLQTDIKQNHLQQIAYENNTKQKLIRERSKTVFPQNYANSLGSYPSISMTKIHDPLMKQYPDIQENSEAYSLRAPVESLNFVSQLGNNRQKQKDFISYQREILRNQKELVALQYRVECLERKLAVEKENGKKEDIRKKLKKLQIDIQNKEKYISELKKI